MKTLVYIALLIIIVSFGYNLWAIDYAKSALNDYNQPYIIGLGAGFCAFIICIILLRYQHLKLNLADRSN